MKDSIARGLYNHWMRNTAPELRPEWDDASTQLRELFLTQAQIAVEACEEWWEEGVYSEVR